MADRGTPDERAAVLATHEAFYAAVEAGDLDRLEELWTEEPDSVCVHPGARPIHGTAAVLRSWAVVMATREYVQFFLTDVEVTVADDVAVVTCTENVLTGEGGASTAFQGGRGQALTALRRTSGGWRLWLHQSTPVGSEPI
ncbi:nuclear transport factor 2 family protein [Nocardioides caldifontis]|uniref:nuclear transport factor 2 family protein n=1 Tax=Nocardioides caldifontis TaxID=2588938 RepID=UPI0011DF9381|nr:nuclear transport factor 2 family protein [Nocardioides caldifontis]